MVYSLDREMRTIYSTKYNDFRPFIPINKNIHDKYVCNYLDFLITNTNGI
jgi:hypothetical protein